MPTVTYLGPSYSITIDGPNPRFRNVPFEVDAAWLAKYSHRLDKEHWRIEDVQLPEEEPTVDADNDGIPDTGWNRKDILTWLSSKGVKPVGYTAKGRALELVAEYLNPALDEEQVQVEEVLVEEQPPQGDDE